METTPDLQRLYRPGYDPRIATFLQTTAGSLTANSHESETAFAPFTAAHGVTVGALVLLFAVICVVGRRLLAADPSRERRFATGIAVACLAGWVVQQGYFLLVVRDLHESLPLHFCDLAALMAPIALLVTHPPAEANSPWWRLWRTLLFFWGFALTTQGLVTPTLDQGPDTPRFYLFWLNHGTVVGLAIYDFVVRGYRPSYRDMWIAIAVTYAYAAALVPLNLALGTNYGFTGNATPEAPTILDALGPWPGRLFWMAVVVAAVYHVAWAASTAWRTKTDRVALQPG